MGYDSPFILNCYPPGCKGNCAFVCHGKVFIVEACRGGFCEELPEAFPVWTEPKPVGSKADPPLAKAEPSGYSWSCCFQSILPKESEGPRIKDLNH